MSEYEWLKNKLEDSKKMEINKTEIDEKTKLYIKNVTN